MYRNLNKRRKSLEPETIVSSITESILRVLTCTNDKKLIEDCCNSLKVSNPGDVKLKLSVLLWQLLNKTQGIPNPFELAYNSSLSNSHHFHGNRSEYTYAQEPSTSNMMQEIPSNELERQETEFQSEESDSEILSQLELSLTNLKGAFGWECDHATSTPNQKPESDPTMCDSLSQESCTEMLRGYAKSDDSVDFSSLFDLSLPSASCSSYTDSSVQFSNLDLLEYSHHEAHSNQMPPLQRSQSNMETIREASASISTYVSSMLTSSVQKISIFDPNLSVEDTQKLNEHQLLLTGNCELSSPSDSLLEMDGPTHS